MDIVLLYGVEIAHIPNEDNEDVEQDDHEDGNVILFFKALEVHH